MQVSSRLHPYHPATVFPVDEGTTLLHIVEQAKAPDWFYVEGFITVDGIIYSPDTWRYVKPKRHTIIELKANVQGGLFKKIGLILAAAVLTIATGFIATGGLAALGFGAAFGAGTLGASAAAALVGFGGQFLLKAFTPSPTLSSGDSSNAAQELSRAGINGNPIARGQRLPSIVGQIRYSPPTLIPPYTTLEDGVMWAHTMVGLNGRNEVSGLLVNEVDIDSIAQIQYEVREGSGLEEDTFLSVGYRTQDTSQQELSTFKLDIDRGDGTYLKDQDVPDNSAPSWHRYIKEADASEFHLRVLFDSPIMNQAGDGHGMAFRLRVRKVGDVSWRNLPQFHIQDLKLSGGFRQEFKLIFDTPRGGNWISRNDKLTCHVALKQSKYGAILWDADSYFVQSAAPTTVLPVMTASTTSGVTISTSSDFDASTVGWKAADNNSGTYWRPAADSLPGWIKVDHGTGKTLRSMGLVYSAAATFNARLGVLEGSNDNATWSPLAEIDTRSVEGSYYTQLDEVASYRYHRLTIEASDGAAAEEFRLHEWVLSTGDSISQAIDSDNKLQTPFNASSGHVALGQDGAEIYLDPVSWPSGSYEIEIMRSLAYLQSDLGLDSSTLLWQSDQWHYAGSATNLHFFNYAFPGAKYYAVALSQNKINSRSFIEAATQVFSGRPILEEIEKSLTRIALRAPGIQVRSISALFKGYAREWTGDEWSDQPALSRNPAAYYRDALLLLTKNAKPLPGEVIDEESLSEWHEYCDLKGHTCDAVFSGNIMADVLRILASCGYASTRQSNTFGVVIDYDRGAEEPVGVINPWESQNLGTTVSFESQPQALRVSFFDETDNFREREITVYRDGYSSLNTTDVQIESTYLGITSEAKAEAKALYNLGQVTKRRIEYVREMGLSALTYRRGDLLLLVDKTIKSDAYYGIIKEVLTFGGNVTGFKLYEPIRLSRSADSFLAIPDVDAGDAISFGICVRKRYGGTYTAEIVETGDTDTVTLVTPVADTGQFTIHRPFSVGAIGLVGIRVILRWVYRTGPETFRMHFVPEANEIIP